MPRSPGGNDISESEIVMNNTVYLCYLHFFITATNFAATVSEWHKRSNLTSILNSVFFQVAMSKFEPDKYLPYEKLTRNLEVVKKR